MPALSTLDLLLTLTLDQLLTLRLTLAFCLCWRTRRQKVPSFEATVSSTAHLSCTLVEMRPLRNRTTIASIVEVDRGQSCVVIIIGLISWGLPDNCAEGNYVSAVLKSHLLIFIDFHFWDETTSSMSCGATSILTIPCRSALLPFSYGQHYHQ